MPKLLHALSRPLRRMDSASLILGGFVLVIFTGAGLLMLPAATPKGQIAFLDALFTATSAVCVTGLTVLDTGSAFAPFGQGVILILIQIGGLGVMTVSVVVFRLLGWGLSFRQRMALQEIFAHTPRRDIMALVKNILLFTAAAELSGIILFLMRWLPEHPWPQALWWAVFHAVSGFCNAGFSLFSTSMMAYRTDLLVNVCLCSLIIAGGIGFPVVHELYGRRGLHLGGRTKLSLHTKTVLWSTGILILGGGLIFWLTELGLCLKGASFKETILCSLFQSITCRTAGFNTVEIAHLNEATLGAMMLLMFFGASPGSCGGGVKTTTLAVMVSYVRACLTGRPHLTLFRKTVPEATVSKTLSLLILSAALIGIVFYLLVVFSDPEGLATGLHRGRFLGYLFETVSAFGTVGLSMGITRELTSAGKCLIICMMLVGRVGVLTFSYILAGSFRPSRIEYAQENLMVG